MHNSIISSSSISSISTTQSSNINNTNNSINSKTKVEQANSIDSLYPAIKKNILHKDDYTFMHDHKMSIKLSDQVLIYNTGSDWKIIPLVWALTYPLIYDTYSYGDISHDITIVVCPITLRTVMFKGIFIVSMYDNLTMILKEKNTENIIPIDSGKKINNNYLIEFNKRSEIKITTLRNALIMAPDILYMIVNKHLKINTIVDLSYYSDDKDIFGKFSNYYIHPKTLCYVIQKKKFGTNKEKTYIILGKDAEKNEITGYDTRKSGIVDYLIKNNEKLIRDEAYTLPILWWTAKKIYEKSKVLYILKS